MMENDQRIEQRSPLRDKSNDAPAPKVTPFAPPQQRTAFEDVLGNGAFGARLGEVEGHDRKERLYELLQDPSRLFENEEEDEGLQPAAAVSDPEDEGEGFDEQDDELPEGEGECG